ncbi:MAG: hypothetical protein F4W68_04020 [Cenarchaeum sp. SB0661_bin_35]|nr:hypothetical protein [Cenarchaeum sp. SB0662_bin_33]MYC79650.1 hypothetical protein [Cenarchaeum sp. SB0661_bin_35]MYG33078.1 hypothetical protein [Cenarchaeum sp. SB0677_bin_16]
MDQDGNELLRTSYKNTREDAEKFVQLILNNFEDCNESTSRMWIKTYKTFEKHNIPRVVCF